VLIDGFRTSLSNVAAFRFTNPDDSYSSRMGTPENVGVIGAAFFSEAVALPPPPPKQVPYRYPQPPIPYGGADKYEGKGSGGGGLGTRGRDSAPAASAPAAPSTERRSAEPARKSGAAYDSYAEAERSDDTSNIGTQYGENTYSQVSEVSFVRARNARPDRVITLRYDDYDGLVARGILPRPAPRHARGPSAFPVNRFAPPPPPRPYYWE
jgi:hypothetical protein